jgi:uncharacterized protein (TIGR03083 family)
VTVVDWFEHERYVTVLESETGLFAAAVAGGDPAAEVENCPEWTLADLCRHQGMVHRWVAQVIRTRARERIGFTGLPDADMPEDPAGQAEWLLRGASQAAALLRESGPEEPVWGWALEQRTGFWGRRMAHETLVHRIDAESAVGPVSPVEPGLAADGIDELLHNAMAPASRVYSKRDLLRGEGGTLHLHCTDVHGEWLLRRTPEGFSYEEGHRKSDAAVRGPAAEVMQLLLNRLPDGRNSIQVLGDKAVVELWLEGLTFG